MKTIKENKILKQILISLLLLTIVFQAAYSADMFDTSTLKETLLNQDPDPVEPGEYVELRFKIEKLGNSQLEDIRYELITEYPFSFDNSDVPIKKLGDWTGNSESDEFYILYYKLKVDEKALKGTYGLTLKQTSSTNSIEREIDFDVRVDEKKSPNLMIGNVETSPSKLIANFDEGSIKVEIVNIGDEAAEQVIVDLILPEEFKESFGYSTRVNIGSIEDGQSKFATFYVDTLSGILKGNHEAKLIIKYKESNEDIDKKFKEVELPFDIQIFGRPEYEITSVNVSPLSAGAIGSINLRIKNIGSRESDSTSIQIFKDSSQPFEFTDKSDFIGEIGVNEIGESIFELNVDKDAMPKEYRLKLQIRSVVDNDVLVEDETIVLNVQKEDPASPATNSFFRFGMYGVFLVIGGFLGRRVSKRKELNQKNK